MTTVCFTVSEGAPSAHYSRDEQALNGARDYEVTLTINVNGVERTASGGITLFRDRDGSMGPCGSPLDGWVSGPLLSAIAELDGKAAKSVLRVLAYGSRANGDVLIAVG